jgi:hypothetical protein
MQSVEMTNCHRVYFRENQKQMRKIAKNKSIVITKVTSKKTIKGYVNDPYFVQKRKLR